MFYCSATTVTVTISPCFFQTTICGKRGILDSSEEELEVVSQLLLAPLAVAVAVGGESEPAFRFIGPLQELRTFAVCRVQQCNAS